MTKAALNVDHENAGQELAAVKEHASATAQEEANVEELTQAQDKEPRSSIPSRPSAVFCDGNPWASATGGF